MPIIAQTERGLPATDWQTLADAMAERAALAQSLPDNPTSDEIEAFSRLDAQVQAQMEECAANVAAHDMLEMVA